MSEPHVCPICAHAFQWGADADSAIVEAQGERWLQCRENAHWKLAFHMQEAHPEQLFACPRENEGLPGHPQGMSFWHPRDGHPSCSYCGSLDPATLFAAIEQGCELGPTDKSYKVYVRLPNPKVGQIVETGWESGPAFGRDGQRTRDDLTEEEVRQGYYRRTRMGAAPATVQAKFYFQHLDEDEQRRFVGLLNAKAIRIGYPGYFYRLPFFVSREAKPAG